LFPATLTLCGEGPAASKTLMLNAIQKHFPHLHDRYLKYFEQHDTLPAYYRHAFQVKMKELLKTYQLNNGIIEGAAKKTYKGFKG